MAWLFVRLRAANCNLGILLACIRSFACLIRSCLCCTWPLLRTHWWYSWEWYLLIKRLLDIRRSSYVFWNGLLAYTLFLPCSLLTYFLLNWLRLVICTLSIILLCLLLLRTHCSIYDFKSILDRYTPLLCEYWTIALDICLVCQIVVLWPTSSKLRISFLIVDITDSWCWLSVISIWRWGKLGVPIYITLVFVVCIVVLMRIVVLRRLSSCGHSILLLYAFLFLWSLLRWQELISQVLHWRATSFIPLSYNVFEAEVLCFLTILISTQYVLLRATHWLKVIIVILFLYS